MMDQTASQDTMDSELALFAPISVNRSTQRVTYVEYRPSNALTDSSPVEVLVPSHATAYTDLRRSLLFVKFMLTALDGSKLGEKI